MEPATHELGVESLALRTILLPRDTNGAGTIFGGIILSQIDLAGAGVARNYSCQRFVTVAMREVEFHKPVRVGDVISFYTRLVRVGHTSVTVHVDVEARQCTGGETVQVTEAEVVFVAVDEEGRKIPARPAATT